MAVSFSGIYWLEHAIIFSVSLSMTTFPLLMILSIEDAIIPVAHRYYPISLRCKESISSLISSVLETLKAQVIVIE